MSILHHCKSVAAPQFPFEVLIQSNHADESTVFTDSSPLAHQITVAGNTRHKTTVGSPFSGIDSAIYFDGSGDYLIVDLGTYLTNYGGFTVDFWARPASYVTNRHLVQISGYATFSVQQSSQSIIFNLKNAPSITIPYALSLDAWTHVAVTVSYSNTTSVPKVAKIYINGVYKNKTETIEQIVSGFRIGGDGIGYAHAYLAEIALRHAVVWTADFTPPTAPYEA